jgi:hypothetical protein
MSVITLVAAWAAARRKPIIDEGTADAQTIEAVEAHAAA